MRNDEFLNQLHARAAKLTRLAASFSVNSKPRVKLLSKARECVKLIQLLENQKA